MRAALRLVLAHILACFFLQLVLIAWMVADGSHIKAIRGVMATLFAPILIPLPLLRIGPKMRPLGYAVYCFMYLTAVVVTYGLLSWRARTVMRRLRLRKRECLKCGYDLRATSDRCPECGTSIAEQQKSAPVSN